MSAVNETVVREYFEALGFLVSQPRKYTVMSRPKTADEEVDLVVMNPHVSETSLPASFVWQSADLATIAVGVIGIRGWHSERFSVSRIEQTPEITRFAAPDALKFASERVGSRPLVKILCLPRLPASGALRRKTIDALREKGVDGVISFETMLAELIRHVDANKNYEKSDLLQVLRMLKSYELLREEQMDLFAKPRPHARRKAAPPPDPSVAAAKPTTPA